MDVADLVRAGETIGVVFCMSEVSVGVAPDEQNSVSQPGPKSSVFPVLKRWLREPLLHFLVLGAVLFGAYAYFQRGRGGVESSKQIALSLDDLRTMDIYFESQWHRQPTPAELKAMVEDKVREEVLYREALAMGLDKDDTIVKRRMAQKMQFLAEDVAAAHEPSTAELKAWFEKNSNKFALPSRYSFRHLYFSPDKRGKNAQGDAAKALAKIVGQPEDSRLAVSLADPFMFQDYYGDRAPEALAKEFGPQFVVALEKLKPGSWQGPIESGYGWHLVYVDTVIPGRIPAFEEMEPDVKTAWLGEQKQQAWQKAYQQMRAKYTLLLPAPPEPGAAQAPVPPPAKKAPVPSGEVPPL
jgi:peptidyl-prolyl cis-trans isomerase C